MRVTRTDVFAGGVIVCLLAKNKDIRLRTAIVATGLAFSYTLLRQEVTNAIFQKYKEYFWENLTWITMARPFLRERFMNIS